MSLGKIKFKDGREVELVEVLDDVIVIEKTGKDGDVKRYRLKKSSEMFEQVADQVDALLGGSKKKAIKVEEPDEVELDDEEEEAPAKPAKKTGGVKGSGKSRDESDDEPDDEEVEEPDDEEVEEPKETKKGKKVAPKPVEPDDEDDEVEDETPASKKAVKAEKTSKAPMPKPTKVVKLDDLYDWDVEDGYQALTVNIETLKNANEAAKYFFTCKNERELQAVIFMLNVDRVQTITKTANLNIYNIKAYSDTIAEKDRAKETDFVALIKILDKLTDDDNSALIPEIVKHTAPVDEKSVYIAFDKDATKKVWGFLEKNLKDLVVISDSIADKLIK